MTTLNVGLTATLQTTLGQPGVWAYAVYFDSSGANPTWTELVLDGAIQNAGQSAIELPDPYKGGKVYILVQSQDAGHPHDLTTLITQESDINWGSADAWDTRYDSIELTLQNSPNDVGNLTSVNGFGLPMEMSIGYSDGSTSTRGYNISAKDLFDQFATIGDSDGVDLYDSGPLKDVPRMAFSPTAAIAQNPTDPPFQASDWNAYIATLKVADPGISLAGFFNGSPDANHVWHNAGFYSYSLEWDATAEVFWLSPESNSQIKGYIQIQPDELANSIYSTLGNVALYTDKSDAEPYRILDNTTFADGAFSMNSGENNQWGSVLAEFLTGFTAGFYGTTGASFNPLSSVTVNLNHNWNWDPDYAFGENLHGGLPPDHFQDAYSQVFFPVSNSYGSGYTDNLMRQYAQGGPLIPLSQPAGSPGAGGNVDAINLTIFDDDEMPTGYEPTVLYHYLAPGDGGYEVPHSLNGANFKLSFGNVGMVLTDDTPIAFDIFGGLVSGVPIWHQVTLDPAGKSPWQNWTLVHTSGELNQWSIVLNDGTDQGSGNLLITGFPTSGNDGIYWNRIHVGDKVFNLYTTLSDGGSSFSNPDFAGQADAIAIDGLAVIQAPNIDPTPETVITFTATFLTSSGVSVNPDNLTFDFSTFVANAPTPDAPVAGTLAGTTFTALAGQTGQATNTVTTGESEIAFGWTGLNPASRVGDDPWIKDYTNKTSALNHAEISIRSSGHSDFLAAPPVVAQADIDGQWQTHAVKLGNGTYTVTMQEYLAGGAPPGTEAAKPSGALTLTVDLKELGLAATPDGQAIKLVSAGPGAPSGNWLTFNTTSTSDASGAVLILYATNADGELVSRDGQNVGAGVTIEEATLATLGALHDDDGQALLFGTQALYLHKDLHLNFGLLSDNGTIQADLGVTVIEPAPVYAVPNAVKFWFNMGLDRPPATLGSSGFLDRPPASLPFNGSLLSDRPPASIKHDRIVERYRVPDDDTILTAKVGNFVLKIEIDNDLSVDALLGEAQRATGEALLYLESGVTLDIELAGSSDNTNTLAFVRMDIDPVTGARSVGGVAYGDTDAFRTAVADNLDDAFQFQAGGDFRASRSWTVSGEEGFYAPVLLTESGNIFVVGDANSGGNEYIRIFGHNTFGFEETSEGEGSDFDFNDMVFTVSLPSSGLADDWLV